jgi:pimeloyl-ACP methyl ester carboxylesterase
VTRRSRRALLAGAGALTLGGIAWALLRPDDRWIVAHDGVRLRVRIWGDGPPVLLIHGFAQSLESWRSLRRQMPTGYRWLALDCRGHGRSDRPYRESAYGLAMVDDLVDVLDALELPAARVLGYSMGAMLAAKAIERFPERLTRVVLGGAAGMWPGSDVVRDTATRTQQLRSGQHPLGPGCDREALAAVSAGWPRWIVDSASMARNAVPTLALVGSDDAFVRDVTHWETRMARLKVGRIDGAGHIEALWRPEFWDATTRFFAEETTA